MVDDHKTDYWGRKLYRDLFSGKEFVMVDGRLHTMTAEGEPLSPLKYRKGQIIFKDNG